jgi:uncharacterized protein YbjT (DUF2867 family)
VKPSPAPTRTALLAGGSGFVGSRLLKLLLDSGDYERVHAVSRRPLPLDHARLANHILPLEQSAQRLKGLRCDDAFCCLGTTRRIAGSDEAARRVDVDLVLAFARTARACGARRFVVLSSVGATAGSRHPYLRAKAEMEAGLADLAFESLDILRPGLLLGWRREPRPLELAAAALMPLANLVLRGRLAAWRGIDAGAAAAAMLGAARSPRRGRAVHGGEQLLRLAGAVRRPTIR